MLSKINQYFFKNTVFFALFSYLQQYVYLKIKNHTICSILQKKDFGEFHTQVAGQHLPKSSLPLKPGCQLNFSPPPPIKPYTQYSPPVFRSCYRSFQNTRKFTPPPRSYHVFFFNPVFKNTCSPAYYCMSGLAFSFFPPQKKASHSWRGGGL